MPPTNGADEESAKLSSAGAVGEAACGELAVADRDLLEAFRAPDVAVHAHGAKIEAGHAQRLRTDLAVPKVEAPEVEIGIAVRETSALDRVGVVDQEQEDVAVARCLVPESDGAPSSLIRQEEDALWGAFFTAAPERRRVFEPSSKRRKRVVAPSPRATA
jgi:hypothetical protein